MSTLTLDNGTLWYDQKGSGPPLVLLHGGWQDSNSWQQQVDHFSEEYSVLTFDIRGHGKTGATDTDEYTIDLFVDDLEQLLAHLDIENPILVGASIGGIIIQEYLDRHPSRARGAVISGPLQSIPPVKLPPGMNSLTSPMPAISGMLSTIGPKGTFRSLISAVSATNGGTWLTTESDVQSKAMDAVGEFTREEYEKVFRAVYGYELPDLSHVETPLLVLYGEHEVSQGKEQGKQIAKTVGEGLWQEIPDAGHLANQDRPQAFNAACSEFFAGLAPKDELVDSN